VSAVGVVNKSKMAVVAMGTKVQTILNSLPTSQSIAVMFLWYLGFHGNFILNFINTPKASTHYGEYSYDVS
jgi:cellobiose-specific phosphotransferase system component IIC